MNLDSLSLALSQVSYSVANLTKKNYKQTQAELSRLTSEHGSEAECHLFRCLFSHVDFSSDGKSSGKDYHQTQFLIQECNSLLTKPYFVTTFCSAVDNPLHHQKTLRPSQYLLGQLSRVLRLNQVQELVFALALTHSSVSDTRQWAEQFIRSKLPEFIKSASEADTVVNTGGLLHETNTKVIHFLITQLLLQPKNSVKEKFGVTPEQIESLLVALKKDFAQDQVPLVLSPYLQPETNDFTDLKPSLPSDKMDNSLADMVAEVGSGCTASVEECRNTLLSFGVRELSSASVARVLVMVSMVSKQPSTTGMADHMPLKMLGGSAWNDIKDHSSNTWNVDILVQVIRDLAPHISWQEVVREIDHPGMNITTKAGLRTLVQALRHGLMQESFPVELLYSPWKNTEGQLSFITQSLKNPDVFCFGEHPYHPVSIEILKTPPDEENRDIATWKSRDLVDCLLRLADAGHPKQVIELFKFPKHHCPDLLALALLQSNAFTTLKRDLLSELIPQFLGNHPNSAVVLQYAWHSQTQSTAIRTLVMGAMAHWYSCAEHHDQNKLTRILDVAQDLKALSMLLNASSFAFVIDLACLASRREYLKLDKWLTDKIREHQEPFLQACVNFLKRRCPQLMGAAAKEEQPPIKSQVLPHETIAVMLSCLKNCVANVSAELSDAIMTMVSTAPAVLSKARQQQPNPQVPGMGALPRAGSAGISGPLPAVGPQPSAAHPAMMPPSNPLDPLQMAQSSMASAFAGGVGGPSTGAFSTPFPGVPLPTSSGAKPFPGSMPSAAPGSPSKGLSAPQQQPQLHNLQTITSAMNSLTLHSTVSTRMSSRGTPTSLTMGGFNAPENPTAAALQHTPAAASVLPEHNFGANTQGLGTQGIGTQGLGTQGLGTQGLGTQGLGTSASAASDMSNASVLPAMNQQFTKEIEDEANSYFQRIYNHPPHPTISIDEVLDMLKRFKDSASKKEKDVFACMLRNLFEEYRFFPQYPDKELHTTAVLFGGIIEQGLVTYMDLGIALRYVLEALRKQHGSKMYIFGIAALDRFKSRLKEYPQYCQFLASIQHFSQFPSHLKEYVEHGSRSQEPPNAPQGPVPAPSFSPPLIANPVSTAAPSLPVSAPAPSQPQPPPPAASASSTSTTTAASNSTATSTASTHGAIARPTASNTRPSIANATNIDTLIAGTEGHEEVSIPPESIQDKVFFIFNNLSLANMDQKSGELKDFVTDEFLPWVAQYLVMKRASIEHNFHTLYAHFIDHLKKDDFMNMVISETFRNIKVLLGSDNGVANFSDRSLLKNLGHWLGLLTLARNKPILQLDIDLKSLVYEAYQKGQQELLYVVPFVAKVVESCAKSKVFKPYNPWTMAIMNVLAELHLEPDLKLNLKFEIEVLCKTLSLDINDLTPSTYLKDKSRLETLECQLSAATKVKESSTPQPEEPLQINMPTPTTAATMAAIANMQAAPAAPPVAGPSQPKFGYHEINIISPAGLTQHININERLAILQTNAQLKQFIVPAIEGAVQELIVPVVDRSIKIALTTSEQIVKKDFALDPEESRMRVAAHHIVRFMTAGMALITGREPLLLSISNKIKSAFTGALGPAPTQMQKDAVEQASQVIAQDNVELCCAFIQKMAVEKAIPEMDKRLHNEYDLRKIARSEGRRYCDPIVLTYQAERMPEQIRLKVGGVTHQQIAVYEEFARNTPGFLPAAQEAGGPQVPYGRQMQGARKEPMVEAQLIVEDVVSVYDKLSHEIKAQLSAIMSPPTNPLVAALHSLLESVMMARNARGDIATALALLQKTVDGLLEGLLSLAGADPELLFRYRDCHLLVLRRMQDPRAYGPMWTNKNITQCLLECREEYRYNIDAVDCLVRSGLVNMQQYDVHLAQTMENGLNYMAVAFAMQLVQRFCVDEKHDQSHENDFFNTIDTLARMAQQSRQVPEGLPVLLETIRQQSDQGALLDRNPHGPVSMMQSGISQAREFDDPPGLHDKTEFLLREWVAMYHLPDAGRDSTKAFSTFVGQMHQQGILRTDDLITRFFRLCTEMCVDLCYTALAEQTQSAASVRNQCFHTLDAFVRLIALLVKHSGDTANTVTKINLLNKVLGIVAGVLLQDHEVRHREFQQLSYHRIFIMLFIELNAPEHILENINFQVLTAFCNTFHILRPAKAPGFVYAWLELVSHRVFIGRMLAIITQQRGWNMYAQLLIDLFKFLTPFLRNNDMTKSVQVLYKGCLRVLLVLLHDFPEFLCEYHYMFCNVIPPNCIQMRNLILSAFPLNMRLPDPFTPNLKVDMLPEIAHPPRIMADFAGMIQPASFKKELDSYLKTRSPVTFLSDLRSKLQVSSEPGMRYNIPVMNALVLHVGNQAIDYIHAKGLTPSMSTIAHSSHMDIFQNLAVDLDTEGRYLFLNAISNQLRYPNSHTHYFSCTLLYLFAEANTEAIQEQITRVLLERLIVNRPHPWGLLITFIELIKNPQFKFWSHEFVRCAPEIEKLFESVAHSCMQPRAPQPGMRENEGHETVH